MSIPALVYDPATRVSGEFYLYYNLERAYYHGSVGIDAEGNPVPRPEAACGSEGVQIPASGFIITRARTPIGPLPINNIPAYSPPGQSAVGGSMEEIEGGSPGDAVDIITLPNPANDVLICYDQGFNVETGDENRPIPRKFNNVDHYVRQRVQNTINLSEFYVCNLRGLSRLRNRTVTLIGKFFPAGGATPSEIIYFTDVRLSVPREIPEDANESVQVNATGTFKDEVVFSADPDE